MFKLGIKDIEVNGTMYHFMKQPASVEAFLYANSGDDRYKAAFRMYERIKRPVFKECENECGELATAYKAVEERTSGLSRAKREYVKEIFSRFFLAEGEEEPTGLTFFDAMKSLGDNKSVMKHPMFMGAEGFLGKDTGNFYAIVGQDGKYYQQEANFAQFLLDAAAANLWYGWIHNAKAEDYFAEQAALQQPVQNAVTPGQSEPEKKE